MNQAIINALVIISPIVIMGIAVLVDSLAQRRYNRYIQTQRNPK